ncbi:MAG: hypothetical protein ABIO70_13640 [Pseudomonadota bacterium]
MLTSTLLMPPLLLWAVSLSAADGEKGIVVRLMAQEATQRPPYTAILTAADGETEEVPLTDDGQESDVMADDGAWTGSAFCAGDTFEVALRTADGTLPGGEVSWESDASNRDVVMSLDDGRLTAAAQVAIPTALGAEEGGPPPQRSRSAASSASSAPAWLGAAALALLLAAGWLLSPLLRLREARALRALRPARTPRVPGLATLPAEDSLHLPDGAPAVDLIAHLVSALAPSGPVVVVAPEGAPLGEVEVGQAFHYRGAPGHLARTLRALMARSVAPPTLVALVDPPDARNIEDLAQNLPGTVRALFVVPALPPLQDVPCFRWRRSDGAWEASPAEAPPEPGEAHR